MFDCGVKLQFSFLGLTLTQQMFSQQIFMLYQVTDVWWRFIGVQVYKMKQLLTPYSCFSRGFVRDVQCAAIEPNGWNQILAMVTVGNKFELCEVVSKWDFLNIELR